MSDQPVNEDQAPAGGDNRPVEQTEPSWSPDSTPFPMPDGGLEGKAVTEKGEKR